MKTFLALVFTLGLCTCAHAVTNLVQNGDFETGDLSSWTGTNAYAGPSGSGHAAGIQSNGTVGSLQQSFTTTIGAEYYVAADAFLTYDGVVGTGTIAVQDGVGGPTIGSRPVLGFTPEPGVTTPRIAFVFTATSTTTNLIFSVLVPSDFTRMAIENVVVYEMAPLKLAGRYSGHLSQTVSLAAPDTTKITSTGTIAARVMPDGLIVLISLPPRAEGVIFSDGTCEFLGSQGTPQILAKASIKGSQITLSYPVPVAIESFAVTGADDANTTPGSIPVTVTQTIVLTRVGK
jgi:hypothetical protein